jgi:uncharacterized membrane protein YkvA (DUF1232 family)
MVDMLWQLIVGAALGFGLLWVTLIIVLRQVMPDHARLREAIRLLPDLVRLVHRLARDHSLPTGVRIRLIALLVYLALPIDLIPDFIPVLGYADDAIIVAITLRSVVRRAGPDAIQTHWSGSAEGLSAVMRVAGIRGPL